MAHPCHRAADSSGLQLCEQVFVEIIEIDERAIQASPETIASKRNASWKESTMLRASSIKMPTKEVTRKSREFHLIIQTMEDGFNAGRRCVDASAAGFGAEACARVSDSTKDSRQKTLE